MGPIVIPAEILSQAAAIGRGWWKAGLGALLAAAPCFLVGQCDGAHRERGRADDVAQVATAKAVVRNTEAKANQRIERAGDALAVDQAEQERAHASESQDDSVPSLSRRARACVQLRQQGTPAAARAAAGCDRP